MTPQERLNNLGDRMEKLWVLMEDHPESPKFGARERKWFELKAEYERISDGIDLARREGTQSTATT